MVSDKTRRDAFIEQNLGLVHACAGRFRGRGIEYDDLYSAGCMGLVKACDNFDESRGVCFSTYAVPVILGEIKKLFRDSGTVKVSRSLKELGMRVQAAREHHMKVCGTEPTLSQLAEELNEPTENITLAIQAAQPAMSLTPENEEEDRQMDIPVESPEEALAERISLEEVLHALPEQDRQLIRLRFYGNKTQSETAKVLHTTQVQISRRERKILVQLRRRRFHIMVCGGCVLYVICIFPPARTTGRSQHRSQLPAAWCYVPAGRSTSPASRPGRRPGGQPSCAYRGTRQ